jgi:hypothetical protein
LHPGYLEVRIFLSAIELGFFTKRAWLERTAGTLLRRSHLVRAISSVATANMTGYHSCPLRLEERTPVLDFTFAKDKTKDAGSHRGATLT